MPRRGETAVVPIDVTSGGRGGGGGGGEDQERPKSERHRSRGPGHHGRHGPNQRGRPPPPPPPVFRPFRRWFPFLVPLFVVANVALFVLTMFAFQSFKENPLVGPSSAT
nr:unnamed protein product [Digitaria exilis]